MAISHILNLLNLAIEAEVAAGLIASGQTYLADAEGELLMDIEQWKENARTVTRKGREELQAEAEAHQRILGKAKTCGLNIEEDGTGDGLNGPVSCYILTPVH